MNLLLFFLLLYQLERGKLPGRLLQLYLLIYPVYRFVLEFFRGDDYRGFLFGLSTSQILSVVLFGIFRRHLVHGRQAPSNRKTHRSGHLICDRSDTLFPCLRRQHQFTEAVVKLLIQFGGDRLADPLQSPAPAGRIRECRNTPSPTAVCRFW